MDYQAAKWLKIPMLVDAEELKGLFSELGDFFLFSLGRVVQHRDRSLSRECVLGEVGGWIQQLKEGVVPLRSDFAQVFPFAFSSEKESLQEQKVGDDRFLMKIRRPVIQFQAHFFTYSSEEHKLYPGVFGPEAIFWGIQCSYPQIFIDEENNLFKVDERFPNTNYFRALQRWVRNATRPLTLRIDEKMKKSFPVRLGKRCFSWINTHPQLMRKGLQVEAK
jgi:hypothetical protein